ncbi:hypothetical protein EDB80DRAFT_770682 [Ilyonectria destructans]|nr:hypothetical protein EDB80DRAFT_770682 [Ilyonectria destructans]
MPQATIKLGSSQPKDTIAIFNQGYSLPASVPFLDIPQPNMGALLAGVNGLKDAECGPWWPNPAGNAIRCQCFPRFPRPRRALNVEVASGTGMANGSMQDALSNPVEIGIVDEAAISISHVSARHVMRSHEQESSQVQVHFHVTELNNSNSRAMAKDGTSSFQPKLWIKVNLENRGLPACPWPLFDITGLDQKTIDGIAAPLGEHVGVVISDQFASGPFNLIDGTGISEIGTTRFPEMNDNPARDFQAEGEQYF